MRIEINLHYQIIEENILCNMHIHIFFYKIYNMNPQ